MAMHNIDRMGLETSWETGSYEDEFSDEDEYESSGEYEFEFEEEGEGVFDEAEEMELAAELLEIQDEEELDLFLGKLIKRASSKIRKAIKSPIGRTPGRRAEGRCQEVPSRRWRGCWQHVCPWPWRHGRRQRGLDGR